jgi:uncharacterized phiE125 gp8 family phage protein
MPFLSRLDVVTPAATPAVSVGLVRKHTRIDNVYDDDLLTVYISSATALCEAFLNRALITQTLKYSLIRTTSQNAWPLAPTPLFVMPMGIEWILMNMQQRDIGLPRSPCQSVTSVNVGSWGEADTTLVADVDYNVDLTVDPGRVHLTSGENWEFRDHITFQYVAGYGSTMASIPTPIVHALLLATASFYENRGDEGVGDLPEAVYNLLWPYRLVTFR